MTQLLDSLGWALLHSLWQGGLAFCLVVAFRNLRHDAAPSLRYGFQLFVLIGCFAAFLATFALYMAGPTGSAETTLRFLGGGGETPASTALQTGLTHTAAGLSLPAHPAAYTPLLGLIWCLGFAFMAIRYSAAYWVTQHLRRVGLSTIPPLWDNRFRTLVLNSGLNENIRLFISDRVTGPLTIGFIKPLVLVPAGFLTGLPREQVEAILLHELAHIRRYDYLFNLIQTAIKTVFFFHPAIHYISKQIDRDREEACDDLAVAQTRNPQALARGLAALQLCTHKHEFAMAAKGKNMPLLGRLNRLVGTAEQQRRPEHLIMSVLTTLLIGTIYMGTSGAANAHPEKTDKPYEHAKAAKHNYKFKNTRLNGKSVTLKITEDGRRWVMANGQWVDVDMSPDVLEWVPEIPAPPQPPKFKDLGGIENAGNYKSYDPGFDDKMDQFQIDMEYFEASMDRYAHEMNSVNDREIERAIEKVERAAERAERDAERIADHMEKARDREDKTRDIAEAKHERAEEQREIAQALRERAQNHAERQRERMADHAERQREKALEHAERRREHAMEQAEHQREKAFEHAERQRERAMEHAMEQAEHNREHAQKHANKTHARYKALREALYAQLLNDGMIGSQKETVTFRYKDNHWTANGVQVPSATENQYCRIMSDMGIRKASLTKVEISEKSTHVVTTSKSGKNRNSHKVTVGEFNHEKTKTIRKHKHKDSSIHDPTKTTQITHPVTPPMIPVKFETKAPVFVMPTTNARVTARYGMTSSLWPETHQGIDLAAQTGTPVFAAADGKVKLVTTKDAWGHYIILEHKDGFQTFYGHLNGFNVKRGQTVKAGEVIADVGSTGKSKGPHLHFEIRKNGKTIDPENLIF